MTSRQRSGNDCRVETPVRSAAPAQFDHETPRGHGADSARPAVRAGGLRCAGGIAGALAHRITECIDVHVIHLESLVVATGHCRRDTDRIAERSAGRNASTVGIALAQRPGPGTDRGYRARHQDRRR
jgi:hypothetical protein